MAHSIQRAFRSDPLHPQLRILRLQGSLDGPEQYVAVMNSIFSAQRTMVLIDSCYTVSGNLHFSNRCFCHKQTIDTGYVCSVCLSIFCEQHKKCSTCGTIFGKAQTEALSREQKKKCLRSIIF